MELGVDTFVAINRGFCCASQIVIQILTLIGSLGVVSDVVFLIYYLHLGFSFWCSLSFSFDFGCFLLWLSVFVSLLLIFGYFNKLIVIKRKKI